MTRVRRWWRQNWTADGASNIITNREKPNFKTTLLIVITYLSRRSG
jgi:hypothetical protein